MQQQQQQKQHIFTHVVFTCLYFLQSHTFIRLN